MRTYNGGNSNNPRQLELDYLNRCLEADLVYVCNEDGYIGTTVAFELGVLTSYGQEIYFLEKPSDDLFSNMIHIHENTIYELETLIDKIKLHNEIWNSRCGLIKMIEKMKFLLRLQRKETIIFTQK